MITISKELSYANLSRAKFPITGAFFIAAASGRVPGGTPIAWPARAGLLLLCIPRKPSGRTQSKWQRKDLSYSCLDLPAAASLHRLLSSS